MDLNRRIFILILTNVDDGSDVTDYTQQKPIRRSTQQHKAALFNLSPAAVCFLVLEFTFNFLIGR